MLISRYTTKYDEDTGDPIIGLETKVHRSDWTGEVLDSKYATGYILDYGGSDPCYGSGPTEYEFSEEYGIRMHDFLSSRYWFEWNKEDEIMEAMVQSECDQISHFLRMCRVETARDLIEDGTIGPHQLAGFFAEIEGMDEDEFETLKEDVCP